MRTNIEIDDKVMEEAMRVSGKKTKRDVVDLALRTLVQLRRQEAIRHYRGQLDWQGDLESLRQDS